MDSIFQNPIAPTPEVNGGHDGTRGGFDLPDGQKETPGTTIGNSGAMSVGHDGCLAATLNGAGFITGGTWAAATPTPSP